jgi:hypothetical protein
MSYQHDYQTREMWISKAGSVSTNSDDTIIASPGPNRCLVLTRLQVQQHGTGAAKTVYIKHGTEVVDQIRCVMDGAGFRENYEAGREVTLPADTPLILNNASGIGWSVRYREEQA